uniref:ATP synthase F1 subunit epsilon n=1 Tax=Panagrolaimus sp. JU765 TaxID=591449 RepID=A0AC34QN68_9BILA
MAQRQLARSFFTTIRSMSSQQSDLGSGSGKGLVSGGSGGSVRDAGGAFGKLEAAREEEYFHKLKQAQLKELKGQLAREIEHHEQQQKNHAAVIARHKKRIDELTQEETSHKK